MAVNLILSVLFGVSVPSSLALSLQFSLEGEGSSYRDLEGEGREYRDLDQGELSIEKGRRKSSTGA